VTAPPVAQIAERLSVRMRVSPTTFEEFADGRASASAAVVEKHCQILGKSKLVCRCWNTNRMPSPKRFSGWVRAEKRFRPKLANGLDHFHPDEHAQLGHVALSRLVL